MNSAIKKEEDKTEYFDDEETLNAKIETLTDIVKKSKHFVAFTGAGLSTGSGIPDYRSGANTVMATGAGCWEKAANIEKARKEGTMLNPPIKTAFVTTISKAKPSVGHMAMVEMMNQGYLKHIISQNIDGLHRKSGIPENKITELHGNTNTEICQKCESIYLRDYRTRNSNKNKEH